MTDRYPSGNGSGGLCTDATVPSPTWAAADGSVRDADTPTATGQSQLTSQHPSIEFPARRIQSCLIGVICSLLTCQNVGQCARTSGNVGFFCNGFYVNLKGLELSFIHQLNVFLLQSRYCKAGNVQICCRVVLNDINFVNHEFKCLSLQNDRTAIKALGISFRPHFLASFTKKCSFTKLYSFLTETVWLRLFKKKKKGYLLAPKVCLHVGYYIESTVWDSNFLLQDLWISSSVQQ